VGQKITSVQQQVQFSGAKKTYDIAPLNSALSRQQKKIIKNIWLYQIFFLSFPKQKTINNEKN